MIIFILSQYKFIYSRHLLKNPGSTKSNNDTIRISRTDVDRRGSMRIGRDKANDIVINGDSLVSRFHAILECVDSVYYVTDNGSTNGTYVNNNPSRKGDRIKLNSGDKIKIGSTTVLFG